MSVQGLKISGLAGGAFLLSKIKPEWGQQFLFDNLKKFPGVPAKFSQWLEQKWDLNQNETLPIMNVEQVRHTLLNEVPQFYNEISFISEMAWPASIGQVHRVRLKSGQELAVKVQYPGLASEVKTQIDQLIWLMEKSPARKYGFNGESWRNEFHSMFGEELNYEAELKRQQNFYREVGPQEWVLIPKVFPEWSSKIVLVQEFVEGKTLDDLTKEKDLQLNEKVADELIRSLIRSMLNLSMIHGDLQPKNWSWNQEHQKIIYYDFGSCIEWGLDKQKLFASLIMNIKTTRDQAPLDYFVELGFDRQKLLPIESQLPLIVECLLEPFWNQKLSRLSYWNMQTTIESVLGDQSWYFRTAGPPWFLWLMRSFGSVFYALKELDDRVPIANIFMEELSRCPDLNYQSLKLKFSNKAHEDSSVQVHSFLDKAQFLRIHVKEGVNDIAIMKFPVHLVGQLEDLMNPEILEKIKEQNLNIEDIKSKAYRSGLIKQDLFNLKKDSKSVRVWIE